MVCNSGEVRVVCNLSNVYGLHCENQDRFLWNTTAVIRKSDVILKKKQTLWFLGAFTESSVCLTRCETLKKHQQCRNQHSHDVSSDLCDLSSLEAVTSTTVRAQNTASCLITDVTQRCNRVWIWLLWLLNTHCRCKNERKWHAVMTFKTFLCG